MAFVYILRGSGGRYYIGSTLDIDSRLAQHQQGHTHSTRRMGKLDLVFKQEYDNLSDARKIERKLKNLKRKDYLKEIIRDGSIKMHP